MAINKLNPLESNTNVISELESRPNLSAASLQAKFDAAGEALKTDINSTIIPAMNSVIETLNLLESGSLGSGDMMTTVYDKNKDGKVDNAERIDGLTLADIKLAMNPVGTIVMNITGVNPSEYIGGTWEQWSKGRVPVGLGTIEQNTNNIFGTLDESELALNFVTPEAKSGKYFHTLTKNQLPVVEGTIGFHYSEATNVSSVSGVFSSTKTGSKYRNGGTEGGGATSVGGIKMSFGGGEPHNNMPPYQTCYFWKRIA